MGEKRNAPSTERQETERQREREMVRSMRMRVQFVVVLAVLVASAVFVRAQTITGRSESKSQSCVNGVCSKVETVCEGGKCTTTTTSEDGSVTTTESNGTSAGGGDGDFPPCFPFCDAEDADAVEGSAAGNSTTNQCPPAGFDSLKDFNLTAWTAHPWYIQKQAEVIYQKPPFFCVRANYKQASPTEVDVYNTASLEGVDGPQQNDGPPLKAVIDDPAVPSKLKVGPAFLPPSMYGPYWVVYAGPTKDKYEYGIVSGGPPALPGASGEGCVAGGPNELNGAGLWLFTEDPNPSEETVKMLEDKAKDLGLDLSVLEPVVQEGCTYPPE